MNFAKETRNFIKSFVNKAVYYSESFQNVIDVLWFSKFSDCLKNSLRVSKVF